jgi:hypothetical protein
MKTRFLIPVLFAAAVFTSCGGGNKEADAYKSSSDTASSATATDQSDTLINKDTVMKDSTQTGPADADDANNRTRKEGLNP